jgi:nicotinamidase-related amidase
MRGATTWRRSRPRASRAARFSSSRARDDDDERRREIDRLLEALDAASATPQPVLFPRDARRAPLSAFIEGFSLHAATRVMASDRRGLWRLCAYGARGAVASSRLSELPDGRFAYQYR